MTAEERLKFYAGRFNTVEVDSTYYALPSERMVMLHTERTPDDFMLHYKAFGLMTQHSVDSKRLPKAVKMLIEPKLLDKPYFSYKMADPDVLDLSFKMFESAMRPAHNAGKLGTVLFQYPPWFKYSQDNLSYIEKCRHKMPDYHLAVEFRNPSWVDDDHVEEVMDFLKDKDLIYTSVDEPQFDSGSTMPGIMKATSKIGYIRLHGRNKDAWYKKGISPAERFAYLYSGEELGELSISMADVFRSTDSTFVMFNNCFQDYGVRNAGMLKDILKNQGVI